MSRRIFLLVFAALALVSPAPLRAWRWADSTLTAAPMPANFQPNPAVRQADFDQDGRAEALTLTNGRAEISTSGQVRWQSPPAWQVKQALAADLNHNGLPEAVLLVWRPFKPWPIDSRLPSGGRIQNFHNAQGFSCHIILIGWYKNAFRERWAGSALAAPVTAIAAADLNGDGQPLLVTLESTYDAPLSAPAQNLKVWEWNGFGFGIVSTVQGSFTGLAIGQTQPGAMLVLTP